MYISCQSSQFKLLQNTLFRANYEHCKTALLSLLDAYFLLKTYM